MMVYADCFDGSAAADFSPIIVVQPTAGGGTGSVRPRKL
jgi:hypothetical protein